MKRMTLASDANVNRPNSFRNARDSWRCKGGEGCRADARNYCVGATSDLIGGTLSSRDYSVCCRRLGGNAGKQRSRIDVSAGHCHYSGKLPIILHGPRKRLNGWIRSQARLQYQRLFLFGVFAGGRGRQAVPATTAGPGWYRSGTTPGTVLVLRFSALSRELGLIKSPGQGLGWYCKRRCY